MGSATVRAGLSGTDTIAASRLAGNRDMLMAASFKKNRLVKKVVPFATRHYPEESG
jgi:hypothetical protein